MSDGTVGTSILRPVVIASIVTVAMIVGGLALLGIPGALYAYGIVPVVEALRGYPPGSLMRGSRAWPTAIYLTIAVPLPLPLLIGLGLWWFEGRGWRTLLAALAGLWLWGILFTLALTWTFDPSASPY